MKQKILNFINMNWIKKNVVPILLVIGGVLDFGTDLFVQLFDDLGAPSWIKTCISISALLYVYFSKPINQNAVRSFFDIGGGGIKNPPKP